MILYRFVLWSIMMEIEENRQCFVDYLILKNDSVTYVKFTAQGRLATMHPNLHSMYIGTMNPQTHSPDTFAGGTILSYIENEKCQICRFQRTIKELQVHSKCSRHIRQPPDTFAETFKRLQTHSQTHSKGSRHIRDTFKRLQTHSAASRHIRRDIKKAPDTFGSYKDKIRS